MKIALSGSTELYALVDQEDYKALSQFKWYLSKDGYAARRKGYGTTYMHRLVMNTPLGMSTDHINHDKLDNRKSNLRICTHAENMVNRVGSDGNRGTVHKVIVKGHVYWVGAVKVNNKRYATTTCKTREMALGALKQMIKDKQL